MRNRVPKAKYSLASNVGFPEKMKLHNCHIYAKDLGLSHAVFLAVSSVFVSYYETSLDQG